MRDAIAFFFALLLLAPATLVAQGHGGGCHCGQWTTTPIAWTIEHPPGAFFDAAKSEFDNWNNVAGLFTYSQGDLVMGAENGRNEIGFLDVQQVIAEYGIDIDEFTFGFAPSWPESAFGNFNECPRPLGAICNGVYTEADVVMNSDFINGWTTGRPPDFDDNTGPALYEATALHELGHTFGLHHNFDNLSTMNYYHDFAAHYLAIADAAATRTAYPSQTKSMTDMATYPFRFDPSLTSYDAVSAVDVSPTLVNAGGSLTVRHVTVENVGTTDLSGVIIQFYLSTDQTISASDILLGQGTFEGTFFASGFWDTGSGPVTVKVPATTASGTYYFGARVVHTSGQTDPIAYNNTWVGPKQVTVSGTTGGGPCKSSATDLCLNSSRFRITLAAKNPRDGRTGTGFAIQYNDINGFFAIPELTSDTTNFEVFVKILDGRAFNGKYWVFYGGLTDFEYTITVTDTQTGVQRTYFKPGFEFTGGADTSAF